MKFCTTQMGHDYPFQGAKASRAITTTIYHIELQLILSIPGPIMTTLHEQFMCRHQEWVLLVLI